jgi:hypothetical protein
MVRTLRNLFTLIFFFFLTNLYCQNSNFLKSFSLTAAYSPSNAVYQMMSHGIATLSPSSFIMAGQYSRNSFGSADTLLHDGFLIKNSFNGDTRWFRKYRKNGRMIFFESVGVFPSKDILAVGSTLELNNKWSGIILKTDSNGHIKQVKRIPNERLTQLLMFSNGSYVIASITNSMKPSLTWFDATGVALRKKVFSPWDTTSSFQNFSLVHFPNKSVILLGNSFNSGTSSQSFFLLMVDSVGNKIKDLQFTDGAVQPWKACLTSENDLVITGTFSGGNPSLQGLFIRFDQSLNVRTAKVYALSQGYVEFGPPISFGRNNLVLMTEPEFNFGARRAGLTFVDTMGTVRKILLFNPDSTAQWPDIGLPLPSGKILFSLFALHRVFGVIDTVGNYFCKGGPMQLIANNYSITTIANVLSSQTKTITIANDSLLVYTPHDVKLSYICSNGPSSPLDTVNAPVTASIKKYVNDIELTVFPNPAADKLNFYSEKMLYIGVQIYSSTGELLMHEYLLDKEIARSIDISRLNPGMYLVIVQTLGGNRATYKMVKN